MSLLPTYSKGDIYETKAHKIGNYYPVFSCKVLFINWLCRVQQIFYGNRVNSIFRIYVRMRKEQHSGVICGLLTDVFWGNTIGFYILLYTVIGYLNGTFERLFYDEDIKLPLVLISGSELIYGGIICFCGYILKGDFSFGTYLIHIILPELVYTILATLIVYQIILHINKKLEAEEQRSASRFV